MKTYKVTKLGQFKSTTDDGYLAKTYIQYAPSLHSIAIRRYYYGEENDDYRIVKRFKGKCLHEESMHFKWHSFMTVLGYVLNFMSWNTKLNQSK